MNKLLNYYYKMYPNEIYKSNTEHYFFIEDDKYYIINYDNIEQIKSYNKIIEEVNEKTLLLDDIVKNNNGELTTKYNKKTYVVIKKVGNETMEVNKKDILKYHIKINNYKNIEVNELDNMKKVVDKIEILFSGYKNDYLLLQRLIDYYVGIAENSISYLSSTINDYKDIDKCLSHKKLVKLTNKELTDINNICYNYYLKDMISYLKSKIEDAQEYEDELNDLLKHSNFEEHEYRYLYSAIIYPYEFFYDIEEVLNNNKKEKEVYDKYSNINKTENIIYNTYNILNKYCKIEKIDWINK